MNGTLMALARILTLSREQMDPVVTVATTMLGSSRALRGRCRASGVQRMRPTRASKEETASRYVGSRTGVGSLS